MKYDDIQTTFIVQYAMTKEVTIKNEIFNFCYNAIRGQRQYFSWQETSQAFKHFKMGYIAAGGSIE